VWLDRFESQLETDRVARWIVACYNNARNKDRFLTENENAGRISTLLGQLLDRDEAGFKNGPHRKDLYKLVNRLATRGDARAAAILKILAART
jgi:hypothetical protein